MRVMAMCKDNAGVPQHLKDHAAKIIKKETEGVQDYKEWDHVFAEDKPWMKSLCGPNAGQYKPMDDETKKSVIEMLENGTIVIHKK